MAFTDKIFLLLFTTAVCFSQNEQKYECIKNSGLDFSSKKVSEITDADFDKLIPYLYDKKVILLGEHIHGAYNLIELKNKLIKYLHRRLNFEVLFTEIGRNELSKKNVYKLNDIYDVYLNFESLNYGYVHQSFNMLVNYIFENSKTNKPLYVEPFDLTIPEDDLNIVFSKRDSVFIRINFVKHDLLFNDLNFLVKKKESELNFLQLKSTSSLLKNLYTILEKKNADTNLIMKCLTYRNIIALKTFLKYEKEVLKDSSGYAYTSLMRDEIMFENIKFLSNTYYKNKKIIINASNVHISRNIKPYYIANGYSKDSTYKWLGDYIYNYYKEKVYSIAFTYYNGYAGEFSFLKTNINKNSITTNSNTFKIRDKSIFKLPNKSKDSFEYYLFNKNIKIGFFNLKNSYCLSNIQDNKISMGFVFQGKTTNINWASIYDSFFFVSRCRPSYAENGLMLSLDEFNKEFQMPLSDSLNDIIAEKISDINTDSLNNCIFYNNVRYSGSISKKPLYRKFSRA